MTAMAGSETTRIHTVAGGGGLRLHVREWGPVDAKLVVRSRSQLTRAID